MKAKNTGVLVLAFLLLISIFSFSVLAADAATTTSTASAPLFTAPNSGGSEGSAGKSKSNDMTDIMLMLMMTGMMGKSNFGSLALLLPLISGGSNMNNLLLPLGLIFLLGSGGKTPSADDLKKASEDKTLPPTTPQSLNGLDFPSGENTYRFVTNTKIKEEDFNAVAEKSMPEITACKKLPPKVKNQIFSIENKGGLFAIRHVDCEITYYFIDANTEIKLSKEIVKKQFDDEKDKTVFYTYTKFKGSQDIAGFTETDVSKLSDTEKTKLTNLAKTELADLKGSYIIFSSKSNVEKENLRIFNLKLIAAYDLAESIQLPLGTESSAKLKKDAQIYYLLRELEAEKEKTKTYSYLETIKLNGQAVSLTIDNSWKEKPIKDIQNNPITDGISSQKIELENIGISQGDLQEVNYFETESGEILTVKQINLPLDTKQKTKIGEHIFQYKHNIVTHYANGNHEIKFDKNWNVLEAKLGNAVEYLYKNQNSDNSQLIPLRLSKGTWQTINNQNILMGQEEVSVRFISKASPTAATELEKDFAIERKTIEGEETVVIRGKGDSTLIKRIDFFFGETVKDYYSVVIEKNAEPFAISYNPAGSITLQSFLKSIGIIKLEETGKSIVLHLLKKKEGERCLPVEKGKIKIHVGCVGQLRTDKNEPSSNVGDKCLAQRGVCKASCNNDEKPLIITGQKLCEGTQKCCKLKQGSGASSGKDSKGAGTNILGSGSPGAAEMTAEREAAQKAAREKLAPAAQNVEDISDNRYCQGNPTFKDLSIKNGGIIPNNVLSTTKGLYFNLQKITPYQVWIQTRYLETDKPGSNNWKYNFPTVRPQSSTGKKTVDYQDEVAQTFCRGTIFIHPGTGATVTIGIRVKQLNVRATNQIIADIWYKSMPKKAYEKTFNNLYIKDDRELTGTDGIKIGLGSTPRDNVNIILYNNQGEQINVFSAKLPTGPDGNAVKDFDDKITKTYSAKSEFLYKPSGGKITIYITIKKWDIRWQNEAYADIKFIMTPVPM